MNPNSLIRPLRFASPAAALLLAACASQPPAPPAVDAVPQPANDFPTQARVEYVLQCMQEHGGQNYNNLYHCVCAVDKLAGQLRYQEFSEAQTFTYLFDTPGERGAEFRDPPQSKTLRDKLKEARKAVEAACFPALPKGGK